MAIKYTDFGIPMPLLFEDSIEHETETGIMADMAEFERKKEAGETFKVSFSHISASGDFDTRINGITIILPWAEFEKHNYSKRDASKLCLHNYEVLISSIDVENKTVYVSYEEAFDRRRSRLVSILRERVQAQQPDRIEIETFAKKSIQDFQTQNVEILAKLTPKSLKSLLAAKTHTLMNMEWDRRGLERIVLPAIIKHVDRDGAIVDLAGYHIPAYLPKAYWNYGRIYDMRDVCKVGDITSVAVLMYKNHATSENGRGMYICARTPLIEDPWENLQYRKGDIIKVRCEAMRQSNWFGFTEGLDIEVYCEYPGAEDHITIAVGKTYECFVYNASPQTHLLKARPFREITNKQDRKLKTEPRSEALA